MTEPRPSFPFSAIVGQEVLKRALILSAIDPSLGGVLIRGEKGTAKSTAARALAHLLPPIQVVDGCSFGCDPVPDARHCAACESRAAEGSLPAHAAAVPFVDLPIGATEDRVLGTLDLGQAIKAGERRFEPGLLARAHRGILYVDEVNLLPDHLVDALLDAAATGVHTVEREGISLSHPAELLLVGTMNPEEGDLRPQLLDRFALAVHVSGPTSIPERTEIVRRRVAFDADPRGFFARWRQSDTAERERVAGARARLAQVCVPDDRLDLIARISIETGVEGVRADIVMYRAARALAAYEGRRVVDAEDVRRAAELALPHRRRDPLDEGAASEADVESILREHQERRRDDQALPEAPDPAMPPGPSGPSSDTPEAAAPDWAGEHADDNVIAPDPLPELPTRPPPRAAERARLHATATPSATARRGRPRVPAEAGAHVRSAPAGELRCASHALDLPATLRAAVRAHAYAGAAPLSIAREDLRFKLRAVSLSVRVLFVVDASGSMAARQRMAAAKGAVLALLGDAYRARDQVGLLAFRGPAPRLLLPFTRGGPRAKRLLRDLPGGGRTPLAQALQLADRLFCQARPPESTRILVLVSDGRANVPVAGGEPFATALETADRLRRSGVSSLVVDAESGQVRLGRARQLAAALGAPCVALGGGPDASRALAMAIRRVRSQSQRPPR